MTEATLTSGQGEDTRKRFARNVSFGVMARALYLVSRVGLPPMVLHYIGLAEFSIWSLGFILVSYIGISAFGVSNTYIRFVAERHARNDLSEIPAMFATGFWLMSALAMIILPILWLTAPAITATFHLSPELTETARWILIGTTTVCLADLSFGGFAYLLHGLQLNRIADKVWIVAFMLEIPLMVLFLSLGWGVLGLLAAYALRYIFSCTAYGILATRNIPGLTLSPRLCDRRFLKLFFGFGLLAQINALLGNLLRSAERVLAGALIGVEATGVFELGEKFPMMIISLPSAFNVASFPAQAFLNDRGQHAEVVKLYLDGARYLNLMTGYLMGFLCAFAPAILSVWLGDRQGFLHDAAWIMAVFCLPYQMDVLTGPGSSMLNGRGQAGRLLVYPLSQLALIGVLVYGLLWAGVAALQAVAVGVALAMILSSLLFNIYCNQQLGVAQTEYLKRALLPGLLAYAAGFMLVSLTGQLEHSGRWLRLLELAGLGIAYSLLVAGMYLLIFSAGEKTRLSQSLLQRFGRGRIARVSS